MCVELTKKNNNLKYTVFQDPLKYSQKYQVLWVFFWTIFFPTWKMWFHMKKKILKIWWEYFLMAQEEQNEKSVCFTLKKKKLKKYFNSYVNFSSRQSVSLWFMIVFYFIIIMLIFLGGGGGLRFLTTSTFELGNSICKIRWLKKIELQYFIDNIQWKNLNILEWGTL